MTTQTITLNDTNFESEVLRSELPVLVDFSAEWCGPCKRLAPVIDELAVELAGSVKFGNVDVDQSQQLAVDHKIEAMPTLVLFKGGTEVDRMRGALPKQGILEWFGRQAVTA